jgi:hypothetical protein
MLMKRKRPWTNKRKIQSDSSHHDKTNTHLIESASAHSLHQLLLTTADRREYFRGCQLPQDSCALSITTWFKPARKSSQAVGSSKLQSREIGSGLRF